jgi:hypothetical protein
MGTWLTIVALMLLAGYCAWMTVSGILDARAERPRKSFWQSMSSERHGWAATVSAFGTFTVILIAGLALVGITQIPALLALTGIERFTFPIAVAAFAALFFGARLLFRDYLGKRWVRELISFGSIVVGLGLVLFVLSLID